VTDFSVWLESSTPYLDQPVRPSLKDKRKDVREAAELVLEEVIHRL
jgi:hypothetical protein